MSIDIHNLTREEADKQAVLDHAFRSVPLAPDVAERIRERARDIRASLPVTSIAVDLVRQMREDE